MTAEQIGTMQAGIDIFIMNSAISGTPPVTFVIKNDDSLILGAG